MRHNRFDHFLHQTQIAGLISGRDIALRVATAALMTGVCILDGFAKEAVITFVIIILIEIIAYPSNTRASQFDQKLGLRRALWVFFVNWSSMIPFLTFAVILSQSNGLPFILAGYLWVFGIFVHVSNKFGLLPFYNWSQMTLALGGFCWMLWNLSQNPVHGSDISEWLMVAALMAVYAFNTVSTMTRQNDTHQALESAREEANTRLEELERLSRHDPLTGLMNRRAFDETLEGLMRQHAGRLGVTAFLIDLDGFKPINDSYSHNAGDAVLATIARRLRAQAGKDGTVARLGGDEFAVVKTGLSSRRSAQAFAQGLIAAITKPVPFEQKRLQVGASIGIALQDKDITSPGMLMSGADQAMFLAKQDPDRQIMFFERHAFPVRASLEDRKILTHAMRDSQIIPYYQPKVSLVTGRIVGFEALSRWEHPTRGLLSPADFLPQINELGLQGEFTIHMAEHVLRDLQAITAEGLDPGQVSINVSEATLATVSGHNDLRSVIDIYPHLRRHLTFEITEDIFIARSSEIIQRSISGFRKEGVRISLDDFGTGFASFQHLKELEFDELKLDIGFVRDLGIDPATHVLVEGLLTIGQGLGVQVVAEGVETAQQRNILRNMGCCTAQGYYFGMAAAFDEILLRLSAEDYRFSLPRRNGAA